MPNVQATIRYERKLVDDYEAAFSKAENLIANNGSQKAIEQLIDELDEIVEAIRECYITLSSNYQTYQNRLDELRDLSYGG